LIVLGRTSYNLRTSKIAGKSINDIKFMRSREAQSAAHKLWASR